MNGGEFIYDKSWAQDFIVVQESMSIFDSTSIIMFYGWTEFLNRHN